jgi:CheY-like chemotaxis protein
MRSLVVEDEPDLRALYSENLREAGHEVVTAANGAEGLGAVQRERPDVILVDLMMPVMDGYEFLQHLRRMPEHRDIPAVVVSAVATGGYSRRLGASGFVAKPFDVDELVSLVERCAT